MCVVGQQSLKTMIRIGKAGTHCWKRPLDHVVQPPRIRNEADIFVIIKVLTPWEVDEASL